MAPERDHLGFDASDYAAEDIYPDRDDDRPSYGDVAETSTYRLSDFDRHPAPRVPGDSWALTDAQDAS